MNLEKKYQECLLSEYDEQLRIHWYCIEALHIKKIHTNPHVNKRVNKEKPKI